MKNRYGVVAVALLILQGCAHSALEQKLDAKVAAEPAVNSRQELKTEATALIAEIPGLTSEQRTKLRTLRDTTDSQVESIRGRSFKLRAVLVRDLLATNYDDSEVELIKSQLKDLESQRLGVIFGAVEQANDILGRQSADSAKFMGSLFEPRGGKID